MKYEFINQGYCWLEELSYLSVGSSSISSISCEGQRMGVCVGKADYKTEREAWEVSG